MKHYIAKWHTYEWGGHDGHGRARQRRERAMAVYASSLKQVKGMVQQMDGQAHHINVTIFKDDE